MSGPRKKSLVAGLYAADSLGEIQGNKRSRGFQRRLPCRYGRHSFILGEVCAVCTVCGFTCEKNNIPTPLELRHASEQKIKEARKTKARKLRTQERHLGPPEKPRRYHYYPNPSFDLLVGSGGACHKVGPTWVYRDDKNKWVLMRRGKYNQVLWGLFRRGYVQFEGHSYTHPFFTSPVRIVQLYNFFDPTTQANDARFFWLRVLFQ
jgi:hypothetical protein